MTDIINRLDLTFMLRDWLHIEELFEAEHFSAHSFETTEAMLDIAEKVGREVDSRNNHEFGGMIGRFSSAA
ncbi:hypothetical protein D6851_14845 [Altericroceibacterium spongiae]|uniref:Uncharacterized protein n=1 Tax=Altericroceibacterium spongiae TaxID=2320269 RepID=A0A420EC49_9SPHN|nr:hypothetical protein [Altericroceibacterium spongiae]RKF18251.1 hypothetical protein D6851_14845 [Altericroceibacterium spongiae]